MKKISLIILLVLLLTSCSDKPDVLDIVIKAKEKYENMQDFKAVRIIKEGGYMITSIIDLEIKGNKYKIIDYDKVEISDGKNVWRYNINGPEPLKLSFPEDNSELDLSEINFMWDQQGNNKYVFQIDDKKDFSSSSLPDLEENKRYYWRVYPMDINGVYNESTAEIRTFIVKDKALPEFKSSNYAIKMLVGYDNKKFKVSKAFPEEKVNNMEPNSGCFIFDLNQNICTNTTGCFWDPDTTTCENNVSVSPTNELKCTSLNNQTVCNGMPLLDICCRWQAGSCVKDQFEDRCREEMEVPPKGAYDCEDYNAHTNQILCEQIAGNPWYLPCAWNDSKEICEVKPVMFLREIMKRDKGQNLTDDSPFVYWDEEGNRHSLDKNEIISLGLEIKYGLLLKEIKDSTRDKNKIIIGETAKLWKRNVDEVQIMGDILNIYIRNFKLVDIKGDFYIVEGKIAKDRLMRDLPVPSKIKAWINKEDYSVAKLEYYGGLENRYLLRVTIIYEEISFNNNFSDGHFISGGK